MEQERLIGIVRATLLLFISLLFSTVLACEAGEPCASADGCETSTGDYSCPPEYTWDVAAQACRSPLCQRQSCAQRGAQCGYMDDGCGAVVFCGECAGEQFCEQSGAAPRCTTMQTMPDPLPPELLFEPEPEPAAQNPIVPCDDDFICVSAFPFTDEQNTAEAETNRFSSYSCKPDADESGAEFIYQVQITEFGLLSAAVYDAAGVDVDVHILSDLDSQSCLDRGHHQARIDAMPGTYYIVVDTYVSNGQPQAGDYRVDIGHTVPSRGPCTMEIGSMPRVGDGGNTLAMPATGPVVHEAHLVTQAEPEPYPASSRDKIENHYALSQNATGYVMHRQGSWAPLEGGNFYGCGIGSPSLFPLEHEAWYVNMYWRSSARPARGTRMIVRKPNSNIAVVVAAGYETGPGNLNHIGGTTEETHHYLDTHHLSTLTLGIASDQNLPFGPRICEEENTGNDLPLIDNIEPQEVDEEEEMQLSIDVSSSNTDNLRVFVQGLPPGALWNEEEHKIFFRPDFIQGGSIWNITVLAQNESGQSSHSFPLTINDTITPPAPQIVSTEDRGSYERLQMNQITDAYLDSPGHAGRSFEARIVAPKNATSENPLPVRIFLHGLGSSPYTQGTGGAFRIYPHDPANTYWWGYSENLPNGEANSGIVNNYTQRRVLHLLEWVLKTYPGADANRVLVVGSSMGGAGAAGMGLLAARHFSYVHATLGQTIAANHRPTRINSLSNFWGSPELDLPDSQGMGNWSRADLTRALRDNPEARNQFIFTKHAKDDGIIHFGAVVMPSTLTNLSFYQALQTYRPGHYVIWDEGGHGPSDPLLGSHWWDNGWYPDSNSETYLRRNLAFPAFSLSSIDDNPGDMQGNGMQAWHTNAGFAGDVDTPNDTGWNGDRAGAFNRFLRWKSAHIVDAIDRFEIPLKALDGSGQAASASNEPSTGDHNPHPLPINVNVTLRRVQRFTTMPGEQLFWSYGNLSGSLEVSADNEIILEELPLLDTYQTLIITRSYAGN